MRTKIGRMLLSDKAVSILSLAIVLAIVVTFISSMYARSYESKNRQLKSQLSGIDSMARDVIGIKSIVESKENKLRQRKTKGIVSTLENILKTLGITAQTIKPLGKSKMNEFNEESAELEINDTDLNSIVNLLYKVDVSPAPLKIKAASLKSTFEDPDKLIFKLTVSLMSKG